MNSSKWINLAVFLCWLPVAIGLAIVGQRKLVELEGTRLAGLVVIGGYVTVLCAALAVRHLVRAASVSLAPICAALTKRATEAMLRPASRRARSAAGRLSNTVSPHLIGEVGCEWMQELLRLRQWLYNLDEASPPEGGWVARTAPSIVVRSEAELFGLSMPRFALRVYLDADRSSFVNCRRIGEFCDQARRWGKRRPKEDTNVLRRDDIVFDRGRTLLRPAWVLRKNSCAADSLLKLPTSVPKWQGYETISVPLGTVYGEDNGKDDVKYGTPYLRHTKLASGGLCAQAVCFMATAMLHSYTRGVWGVADVTALASDFFPHTQPQDEELTRRNAQELLLQGLDQIGIARYFMSQRVGLNATWMQVLPSNNLQDDPLPQRDEACSLANALRAYLQSGMPVILPLDRGRMAGIQSSKCAIEVGSRSIYARNGLCARDLLPDPGAVRRRHHAVVAVGYDQNDNFLINDPASNPFLEASAAQIGRAGFYTTSDMNHIAFGWFLPVVPCQVRLPLVGWRPLEDLKAPDPVPFPGLIRLAEILQLGVGLTDMLEWEVPKVVQRESRERFALARLDTLEESQVIPHSERRRLRPLLQQCAAELRCGRSLDHWCWLQYAEDSIWIWDAQAGLPPRREIGVKDALSCLLGVWAYEAGTWRRQWLTSTENRSVGRPTLDQSPPRPGQGAQKQPRADDINAHEEWLSAEAKAPTSLISSFMIEGVEKALASWPHALDHGDCYCFMQREVDQLLPLGISHGLCSTYLTQYCRWTFWASLMNVPRRYGKQFYTNRFRKWGWLPWWELRWRPAEPLSVSSPIVNVFDRMAVHANNEGSQARTAEMIHRCFSAKNVRVLALASFLPEISAAGRTGQKAQSAVRYLIGLCRFLRKMGHPASTIELVAGSLIEGLWPARWEDARRKERLEQMLSDANEPLYAATSMSIDEGLDRLLAQLLPVREAAAEAEVTLALELEPGPLYVLQNWNSVRALCQKLAEAPWRDLSPILGLNLDIAHWCLASITPEMVLADRDVLNRIVHVHIADHGNGHFGDIAPGRIHDAHYFKRWLCLLPELVADRDESFPRFRGGISIELEACGGMEHVNDGLEFVQQIRQQ